jgi:transcriptional regulator with XRE-family HTH domain
VEIIFETLAAQGRTQLWLARQLGIHRSLLAHYKSGARKPPESIVRRSAELLGLPESVVMPVPVLPDGSESDAA